MKIYERIIVFFLVCVLLITILIGWNQSYEMKQMKKLSQKELVNKQQMMNDLLLLESQVIRQIIGDYSNWDDMAEFVVNNKKEWASQNINTLTDTLHVPFIWVFNQQESLIHSYFLHDTQEEMSHLLTREILRAAFNNQRACHFFLPTSAGVTEFLGSTITYYSKNSSNSPVLGYLIIGRLWDQNLINTISNLGSYFTTEMNLSTTPYVEHFDQKTSMLQFSKPLNNAFGEIVSYLVIRIPSEVLSQFNQVIYRFYYIWLSLIGLFLILILIIFFFWIFPPLSLLSETLATEKPERLDRLKNDTSEFGDMARLMISFFQQNDLLQQEIGEKRYALQELQQSEEHFRVLAESLPCYVLILENNQIIYANSIFCHHFEFSFEEIEREDFYTLVHLDYQDRLKQEIINMQTGDIPNKNLECPVLTKTGASIWLDLSLGKTFFHNHPAVIVSGFDITERKKLQQELENTLMIKSNFTSMVSHELRTPLSAIKGAVDLVTNIKCGELNEMQKTSLQIAKRNVDRLHRLINDILDFQKLESGNSIFRFEKVDPIEVIDEAMNTMLPNVIEKGLTLTKIITQTIPPVKADRDRFVQVIINLVSNAIKFTSTGTITIDCCVLDDFVQISVKDTGIGIHEKDIDKLFHQYIQLTDNALKKFPGTGLGLAICKEIIDYHSGKISVTSELGRGTTIFFTLPIAYE